MNLSSAWGRLPLTVASVAYASVLLVTVVETPPTAWMLLGAVFTFALSGGGTVRLADEHGLRSPPIAFFGTVVPLLVAAWWRDPGSVHPLVAMSIHLFGLFVVAAVGAGELFLQQSTGARGT
ncbi:hypothetical protein B4589_014705 [Halolamina sp. CBA1230]|uniref:hypothetical protein n=1 Tax=Halolamina sp. CBA1230 TaxID=1853690 RepID=UPI0009A155C2|nr:hypothetical protein [Halolamina sp. CBA1230]QKY21563.1 hypothetical protein B4589_014705 [Halolamina sp. CBA1230]